MSVTHLGVAVDGSTEFEMVIGLEVHVQLATDSKIFSTARARLGEGKSVADEIPNANTTPVCTGHPGTLPALNEKAVLFAVKAGLATDCKINSRNVFARKHYFYPDSPKGYQISQHDLPVCVKGHLDIEFGENGEKTKRVGITRIHMEEDAGKSVHHSGYSLVNLNRAGVPLIEVVSEPDMRSPEEAGAYLRKLYAIVTALRVCDGNLQEGNFRCDANVSIRAKGSDQLGTRTEIKNVNSFRFVEKAIEYEANRQRFAILAGERIIQETRLYDADKNQTSSMRTKEDAEDYRYFPDPDLLPLVIPEKTIEAIRAALPELPDQKRDRFVATFSLSKYDAAQLVGSASLARFFEESMGLAANGSEKFDAKAAAKTLSNLLTGEVTRILNEGNLSITETELKPSQLAEIVKLILDQTISIAGAKTVIVALAKETGEVGAIIERAGLKQVSDLSALEPIVDEIIAKNPKQLEEYRSGKEKILGFFVGQAMKATQGKANAAVIQELVIKKLKG